MPVAVVLVALAAPARAQDLAAPRAADAGGPRRGLGEVLPLEYGGVSHGFVRIKKGKLTQGSPVTEAGREPDEASRPVTITREVWMLPDFVSRGDFAAFVDDARYLTEAERGQSGGYGWDGKALVQKKEFTWRSPGFAQTDEHPVVLVTWGDANAYAAWVARKTGRRVRLPTEAEWEYAARAGTTTPWYAGTTEQDALASGWFKPNAGSGTHPRRQKGENPFGLSDMAGNVYEWCRDVYAPYGKGPAADPEQTSGVAGEPERRVLRGGSWMRDPKRGRSAARYRATPGTRSAENGFRLVVTDEESLGPGMLGGGRVPEGFATAAPLGSLSPESDAGASVAAVRESAGASGEGSAWPLLLAPAAAAGAVVAWLFARRRGGPGGAKGFSTRPGDDGFYVTPPPEARGARIRYDAVVNETVISDVAPLDGADETFVYTGGRPTAIRILEVIPVGGSGYRQPEARPASVPPRAPPAQVVAPPRRAPSSGSIQTTTPAVVQQVLVTHHTSTSTSSPSTSTPEESEEPFLGTPRAY